MCETNLQKNVMKALCNKTENIYKAVETLHQDSTVKYLGGTLDGCRVYTMWLKRLLMTHDCELDKIQSLSQLPKVGCISLFCR